LLWKKVLEDYAETMVITVTFKSSMRREMQLFREMMRMFDE